MTNKDSLQLPSQSVTTPYSGPRCPMTRFLSLYIVIIIITFLLHHVACGILVSRPGVEPPPPALEAWKILTTGSPGKSPGPID